MVVKEIIENKFLPEQLKNDDLRFLIINHPDSPEVKKDPIHLKKPLYGKPWEFYKYDDPIFIKALEEGHGYAVSCKFGDLLVFDFDDMEIFHKYKDKLPDTFTVKTGSGKRHMYYYCDNGRTIHVPGKFDLQYKSDDETKKGTIVIGPGSLHPSGNRYEVLEDIEITMIDFDFLLATIEELKDHKFEKTTSSNREKTKIELEILEKIKLDDLIEKYGYKKTNPGVGQMCRLGHPSKGKKCFNYNKNENMWNCYSCGRKGGIIQFVAAHEKISKKQAIKKLQDMAGITESKIDKFKTYEEQILSFDKNTPFNILDDFLEDVKKNISDTKVFNRILELLSKQTKKAKKLLITDNKEENYKLVNNGIGYRFTKDVFDPISRSFNEFQISDFRILEKQRLIDYDLFEDKEKITERIFSVPALKKDIVTVDNENEHVPLLLNTCKNKSSYNIIDKDTEAFIKLFDEIKLTEKYGVSCYCFLNGKYYEPKEYDCYRISQVKNESETVDQRESCKASDDYIKFLQIKYTENKIKTIIETLNKIPRDDEEREIWKIILSWSVASFLKMDLHRLKATVYPYVIVIGDHDTGKTKINEVCILRLWNSRSRATSDFGGAAGARLVDLPTDIRPICYQEVEEFPKNWVASLKEAMTLGKFRLSRGMKHGKYEIGFYQNMAIDTNDFSVTNEALENRAIFIYKEQPKNKDINNAEELNYLIDNIHMLGKFIYDGFKDLDIETLWKESKSYIKENYISEINKEKKIREGRRAIEKLATVRFGEMIIEKYGIFTDVKINYFKIYSDTRVEVFNREKLLKEKIQLLLSNIQYRPKDNSITMSLSNILHNIETLSGNITRMLKDIFGIVILHDKSICLTKNFITRLNTELEKNKHKRVDSLVSLSKELKLNNEYKICRYIVDKPLKLESTTLCLKLDETFFDYDETPIEDPMIDFGKEFIVEE